MKMTRKFWAVLLSVLMVAMLLPWSTLAAFAEDVPPCAVYVAADENNGGKNTLYFLRGVDDGAGNVMHASGTSYTGIVYENFEDSYDVAPWQAEESSVPESVESVIFIDSVYPVSTENWFYGFSRLTSIEGIEKLHMSAVTCMGGMFRECTSLTSLDLSSFDLASLDGQDWSNWGIFYRCTALRELKLGEGFVPISSAELVRPITGNCSGRWVRLNEVTGEPDPATARYSDELITNYSAEYAGTWVAEKVAKTGIFAVLDFNVPEDDTDDTLTFMSGSLALDGTLTRDGAQMTYDEIWYGGDYHYDADLGYMDCSIGGFLGGGNPWEDYKLLIDTVAFIDPVVPASTWNWFSNFEHLTEVQGIEYLDTTYVTNMASMFAGCYLLADLDVSGFNTSNVTTFGAMFGWCPSLRALNVSGFDTSKAESMQTMFGSCMSLTELDVSGFDTSNVTDMDCMFDCCSGLTSLDVSHFDTSKVTDMNRMFYSCSKLTELDVSHFDTSNVQNIAEMFAGCGSVQTLAVSDFDTSNTTNMYRLFGWCSSLTSLDVTNFDTSGVTDMSEMFHSCSSLTSLDLGNFDLRSLENGTAMFEGLSALRELKLGEDFAAVANANLPGTPSSEYTGNWMRLDASTGEPDRDTLRSADALIGGYSPATDAGTWVPEPTPPKVGTYAVLNWNDPEDDTDDTLTFMTAALKNGVLTRAGETVAYDAFWYGGDYHYDETLGGWIGEWGFLNGGQHWWDCREQIDTVIFLDPVAPVSTQNWFAGFQQLTSISGIGNLDTSGVTNMAFMFWACSLVPELDVSGFNTANVTNMHAMFNGCAALTELDVSNFRTENVTTMQDMFAGCDQLTSLNVSSFDTSAVTDVGGMFYCCYALPALDISSFDLRAVENSWGLFGGMNALRELKLGENFAARSDSELPTPYAEGYSGKWARLGTDDEIDHSTARDAYNLIADYSAADAGTWVWEPTPPKTGIFALLNWNDPENDTDDTLTFMNGYYYKGEFTREGETCAYDELYYGGDYHYDETLGEWIGETGFMSGGAPWIYTYAPYIDEVVFLDPLAPTSTADWFYLFYQLTSIQGIENLDMSNVTSMDYMFMNCGELTSLDLSSFTLDPSVRGAYLFNGDYALRELKLGTGFTAISEAWLRADTYPEDCTGLWARLDEATGEVDHGTARSGYDLITFYNPETDAGTWVWEPIPPKTGMFAVLNLNDPDCDTDDTLTIMNASLAYNGVLTRAGETVTCDALWYGGDYHYDETFGYGVGEWGFLNGGQSWWEYKDLIDTVIILDAFAPDATYEWFSECVSLTSVQGLELLDTSGVANMSSMFNGCSSLTALDLSSLDLRSATDTSALLGGLTSLRSLTLGEVFVGSWDMYLPEYDPATHGFTGLWVRLNAETGAQDHTTARSAYELISGYDPATDAGTWVWEAWDLCFAEIEAIPAQTYTGAAVTPEITVRYNGVELTPGEDYTVEYYDNENIGTGGVRIGTGSNGLYQGNNSAQFEIVCDHSLGNRTERRENFTPATCSNAGHYDLLVYCADCGALLSSETVTEPQTDHTEGEWIETERFSPTCTEAGWYKEELRCTKCGALLNSRTTEIPASDHTAGEWTEASVSAAVCVEAGTITEELRCAECGALLDSRRREVPPLGHDWGEWEIVREATFEADGTEVRACRRCGETEERPIEWQGNATRLVQFVVSEPMHYIVHLRNSDYRIYSDTTPEIFWYPEYPLSFDLYIYSNWAAPGWIVSVNGRELKPNADGSYTIPAGSERVVVNCAPVQTAVAPISEGGNVCAYCGNVHPGNLLGFLISVIHSVFAIFKRG